MRITPEQALVRLQPNKAPSKAKAKSKAKPLVLQDIIGHAEDDIYIFANDNGGIITPADDSLPSIIGTWEGEGGAIPPCMEDWLAEYAKEVEWWQRYGEDAALLDNVGQPAKAPAKPRQSIPVLVTAKWGQDTPYNETIIINGQHCPTGCYVTATGQVMYYWGQKGYHRGCTATSEYVTKTNKVKMDALPPITVFDYNHLADIPKTDKEKAAVQQMMMHIGRAYQANYKPSGTGCDSKTVVGALRDSLRMGKGVNLIFASILGEKGFDAAIYNELLSARPVMVAGYAASGAGHAFVIDGYDAASDMYHVNWGFGGVRNGYYKLSVLNITASTAYNSGRQAIVGICPTYKLGDVNGDGEVNVTDAMQVIQDAQSGKYSPQADINSDGKVTVADAQLIIDKILGRIDL